MNVINQFENESQEFGNDSFEKDVDLVDEDFDNNFKIEGQKSLIQKKKSDEYIQNSYSRENMNLSEEKDSNGI